MTTNLSNLQPEEHLFSQIKQLLDESRASIARTVNTTVVYAYWNIGKYIVEFEQKGQHRAEFGSDSINKLSARLTQEYGK